MFRLLRTSSDNSDFRGLVLQLDAELRIRDGDDHDFYAQYNKLEAIKHVVLAFENNTPVGCGALKKFSEDTIEVKRMFVPLEYRSKGIASMLLKDLENWAAEMAYSKCILETGEKQPEAIALYKKNHYRIIPNYGQYAGVKTSICFMKEI